MDVINLPMGTRVGGWVIVGRLGYGGFGAVYAVRHTRWPWRKGALKLALRAGSTSHRLEREVKLLSLVKHPHVVRLLDSGYWRMSPAQARLPFLVMEYVPGAHLYTWVAQHDVRVGDALELFKQSAQALLAVHEAGAVHRDIKGENLIIHRWGRRLVLVDFGVGDYEGSAPLTRSQLPPGTEPYRSPEALRFPQEHRDDREEQYTFTPADDVYALGVTWFRALTGTMPFEGQGSQKARRMRLEKRKPRPPSALNPRVPQAVSNLVLRMLSPQPERRPTSAQVAEELTRSGGQKLEAPLFERQPARTRHALSRAAGLIWCGLRSRPRLSLVSGAMLLAALGLMRPLVSPSPAIHPSQESHSMPSLIERILKKAALPACLFTAAGCASGPAIGTRNGPPPRPQPCPETALVAMKALNVMPGSASSEAYIYLDINQPGGASERGVYREGPIISFYDADDGFSILPHGSKLYGYLWIVGDTLHAHWDQIELPDGRKLPFCGVLGFDRDGGHWTEPSTEPGTVLTAKQAALTTTDHFIKPR